MKNVTIVGLGAIGTVYATALIDAGIPLRIALNTSRLDRYLQYGVKMNDQSYDFQYFTPSTSDHTADLIIIATKSGSLLEALDLITPIVGPKTQILPLLNGITSEDICAARFGWERVLYGYFIGHTAMREGNEIRQDGNYRTYFGERDNRVPSARVVALQRLFEQARIPFKTPADMIASLWQKFVVNVGMNQATAILRCKYRHLQTNALAHQYMASLMYEAALVATEEGVVGADKMAEKGISLLENLSPDDGSSMYQDVMSGRITEVDIFADTVCKIAARHGLEVPYNFHASQILNAVPHL